jgi:hypothetical protein
MRIANDHQNQSTKCLFVLLDLLIWFAMLALAPLSTYTRSVPLCLCVRWQSNHRRKILLIHLSSPGLFSTLAARTDLRRLCLCYSVRSGVSSCVLLSLLISSSRWRNSPTSQKLVFLLCPRPAARTGRQKQRRTTRA